MPAQERAVDNWLALREMVIAAGFVQTSLTNFERGDCAITDRRFQYEEPSFLPDQFAMLGFGPAAISSAADSSFQSAWKTINPDASLDYILAVKAGRQIADRAFRYDHHDLKAFYVTRRLSALQIDRGAYRRLFGSDPFNDDAEELAACLDENLLEATDEVLRPTPRGMFFSDSISALLAAPRLRAHRRNAGDRPQRVRHPQLPPNDNGPGYM